MDDETIRIAEELRAVIGKLVRSARQVDLLPPGEAAALGLLDREGPRTTAQLAQLRRVKHQTMAKIVTRLTAEDLVEKQPHPTDGRMTVLRISETGRRVLNTERDHRADWLAEAIAGELTAAQRAELTGCITLLAKLADAPGRAAQ